MGRRERPIEDASEAVPAGFAEDLRELRRRAGSPTYRQLEADTNYSRATLSAATSGRKLPSLAVTLALVEALGGDRNGWARRWLEAHALLTAARAAAREAAAEIAPQAITDGADPGVAGCERDAVTVHARKLLIQGRRVILGQIELRYSARTKAAWGRFMGFQTLIHLACQRSVEIAVDIVRERPAACLHHRDACGSACHLSDLLRTNGSSMQARAAVLLDGVQVAEGLTDRIVLS